MPELPDITIYVEALRARTAGATLLGIRVFGPSWLRTVEPRLVEAEGRRVCGVRRLGKRIVFELEGDLFVVLHLMIAGRLRWRAPRKEPTAAAPASRRPKHELGALEFSTGTLVATEAGTRKRATLHLLCGEAALAEHDPGGLEPLDASRDDFAARLRAGNHTLKRALTDPHVLSGIGNAYSDEILHEARLSPFKQTQKLAEEEMDRLHTATQHTLLLWTDRLRTETGNEFPARVTAFRPELPRAVSGVRRARAAHRLRRERGQLLRALSDRRQAARRSRALATAARRLAGNAGRDGETATRRGCYRRRSASSVATAAIPPSAAAGSGMTSIDALSTSPLFMSASIVHVPGQTGTK